MSDVQEQVRAGERTRKDMIAEPIYTRGMPGGGRVRIELLVADRGDIAGEHSRGRVVIDPRSREKAVDAIVVEEMEGEDSGQIVDHLFRIAQDNAAIARRILTRYPARNGISI